MLSSRLVDADPNGDPLANVRDFSHLSLIDLIHARDLYHRHLTERKGVIATAIGLYLIRKGDSQPGADKRVKGEGPRTLDNSEVRSYSWPCLLAFVEKWVPKEELDQPDLVPRALHMPDGKVVPVCVVEAPQDRHQAIETIDAIFPKEFIGGGYPLMVDVQGEERIASVGCLVTDGHFVYAMTNRHVVGPEGTALYSYLGGSLVDVGTSSKHQLARIPFSHAYPSWPGANVFVNIDVGLVEIADKSIWTPQVFGIGRINRMADLSTDNLTLRLIGAKLLAYGASSREMRGEVKALFYRYKSVGGFEYVSDFLIGPDGELPFRTRRGDSGTVWLLDRGGLTDASPEEKLPMPIAIQWGGHTFTDAQGNKRQSYALAASLTTVCRLLEVDLVRDWGVDLPEYWGTVGHFTIGSVACTIVGADNSKVRKLFKANRTNIAPAWDDITDKETKGMSKLPFVPLADVPDLAWKVGAYVRGPRAKAANGRPLNPEGPNHFADLDEPLDNEPTLLDLLRQDLDTYLDTQRWITHYRKFNEGIKDMALPGGLLPFRVGQIFKEMVQFVKDGDEACYVCAAGILAHYVGDACQPLHISYMHHGNPDDEVWVTVNKRDGTTDKKNAAEEIHADYEATMFRPHGEDMKTGVLADAAQLPLIDIKTPEDAAKELVKLMIRTYDTIDPEELCTEYADALRDGLKKSAILTRLWDKFGALTIQTMSDGTRVLASLWNGAWKAGGGNDTMANLKKISQDRLVDLYSERSFLRSYLLTEIEPHWH